jgi:hypothetical protein
MSCGIGLILSEVSALPSLWGLREKREDGGLGGTVLERNIQIPHRITIWRKKNLRKICCALFYYCGHVVTDRVD